ncbi:hypothetical protein V8G54_024411 [Vigna mungo]|uniref:Uncharacterized protein n=1 Tax=Vigna mungo TaxID=3915 RepID=A0AAQ3N6D5_VIGMU
MIKSDRVAILMMIMLGFVQILSIEAKLPCAVQCGIQCFGSEYLYPVCLKNCIDNCNKGTTTAYNCITKCGVNKTVTVTIGNYFLMKFKFSLMLLFFIIELIILFISFTMAFMYQMIVVM